VGDLKASVKGLKFDLNWHLREDKNVY